MTIVQLTITTQFTASFSSRLREMILFATQKSSVEGFPLFTVCDTSHNLCVIIGIVYDLPSIRCINIPVAEVFIQS